MNNSHEKSVGMGDIAIIGMGCRFPGADSTEEFWKLLKSGKSAITEIPNDRWEKEEYYSKDFSQLGKSTSCWGGFLQGIRDFDADFFGISPAEAETLDPQQRLVLEVVWETIENAGMAMKNLAGSNTGVFVGACKAEYWELQKNTSTGFTSRSVTGSDLGMIPNRVSYTFDFRGPSILVDTLCSSSLVSIHSACQSIRSGDCDMALAGGVNAILLPDALIALSQSQALSPTGSCKTFDEKADGYVRGEGCGIVLLKAMDKALADNDNILGVIKGSAINQDGRSNGISAPNGLAQQALLKQAYLNSGVNLADISYIECHGTGTPLGDPIETGAIHSVFKEVIGEKHNIHLGAVKSSIGHLESAAGIAGLIKLLLMLKYKEIPGQAGFSSLNPRINSSGLIIDSASRDWHTDNTVPRLAGVSAFSFGGVNAHVVVQEFLKNEECSEQRISNVEADAEENLFVLSAESELSLNELVKKYREFIYETDLSIAEICAAVSHFRTTSFSHRFVIKAKNVKELLSSIELYISNGKTNDKKIWLRNDFAKKRKLAYVFSGQGSQYAGMGKDLYNRFEVFKDAIDECDKFYIDLEGLSLKDILFDTKHTKVNQTRYTQPSIFAFEYALAQLWLSLNVQPSVMMGHSIGEYVAACLAGVFNLQDAIKLVSARGRLMEELCQDGAMLAVITERDDLLKQVDLRSFELDVAAYNSPMVTVASGEKSIISTLKEKLNSLSISNKLLDVSHAFHSRMMEPMLDAYRTVLNEVTFRSPKISIISNVTGKIVQDEMLKPEYWLDHILSPVLFEQGIEQLKSLKPSAVVEIGPKSVLTGLAKQCQLHDQTKLFESIRIPTNTISDFLSCVANIYCLGFKNIQLDKLHASVTKRVVLPSYPFDRKTFWLETQKVKASDFNTTSQGLLGECVHCAGTENYYFTSHLVNTRQHYLDSHRVDDNVIFPGAGYVDLLLGAGFSREPAGLQVTNLEFFQPLILEDNVEIQVQLAKSLQGYQADIWSRKSHGEWHRYSSGQLISPVETQNSVVSTFEIDSNESIIVDVDAHYDWLNSIKLNYGPAFRGLKSAEQYQHKIVAQVELPDTVEASNHALHPVLLDSALHALSILIKPKLQVGQRLLPAGIESIWLKEKITARELSVRVMLDNEKSTDSEFVGQLQFYDLHGNILAECSGVKAKAIRDLDLEKEALPCYTPTWQVLDVQSPTNTTIDSTLIIYADDALSLVEEAKIAYGETRISAHNINSLSIDDKESAVRFLDAQTDVKQIVILAEIADVHQVSEDDITKINQRNLRPLFNICKYWSASKIAENRNIAVRLVTHNHYSVTGTEKILPWSSACVGLLGVFANENPNVQFTHIDMQVTDDLDERTKVACAGDFSSSSTITAMRGSTIYGRQLRESNVIPSLDSPDTFRQSGVYWITGGAGGVGKIVSEVLAEQYKAKIIWTGRRKETPEIKQAISEIQKIGGEVAYYQADVANHDDVSRVITQANEVFGQINGVIHAAASVADSALENMDIDDFDRVLTPKIQGSIVLAKAFANTPLDFITFYSSAASFGFNAGQANYVAGGTFMDTWAHYLCNQNIPAKTINWGYWGEVGVSDRSGLDKLMRAQGVDAFTLQEGRAAVLNVQRMNSTQIVPIKASEDLLVTWGLPAKTESIASGLADTVLHEKLSSIAFTNKDDSLQTILTFLRTQVAQIMRTSEEHIDSTSKPFSQLSLSESGFDSLMVMDLRSRVQKNLEITLSAETYIKSSEMSEVAESIYEQILLRELSNDQAESTDEDMETFVI